MEEKSMLRFREDDVILAQGSTKREMYKILSGKAALYLNYGAPQEYLVGVLSEQRCFGELCVLCDKPSTYTVVALEEVLVLRVTVHTFDDFIKHNPHNAIGIMKNLANTVATLSLNLTMLGEDLAAISSAKSDSHEIQDITLRVRQYAAMEAVSKTLFLTSV